MLESVLVPELLKHGPLHDVCDFCYRVVDGWLHFTSKLH